MVLTGGLLATGLWLLSGRTYASDTEKQPILRPALTVQTEHAQHSVLAQHLSANGNVAAWQEANIGAESNGLRLSKVYVNVGDTVKAGQILATFATDMVQADLAQARASLYEAQARAAEARSNADRAQTLQATGALSQQQIEQDITAAQTAQARVHVAQAQLQVQQLRLQQTQVRAPDSGIISARSATVGAVVGSGTELFRMIRQGRLEWRAEVTSTELARLRPGMAVEVSAASGATVKAKLRTVAPTVDIQTRNTLVYVDLPSHPNIRAGMFARGTFMLGDNPALTVPSEALVVREGFNYLFVLGTDQRVQRLKVQTGRRSQDRVEIVSGLDAAASVVVRGAGFLNDGDMVRVAAVGEKIIQKSALTPVNPAQAAIK